jgi:hypothetical protein
MRRTLAGFLIYTVITLGLTYPLILQMGSVLPNDAGDPALNTWILWWNTQAVPFTAAWWNAPMFYPVPGTLTFSENLLGLSLVSTPLSWLGVGPQAAYNVVFLLTFPLSAIGAALLTFELTKRRDAAFIAGMLFGFAPYRIAHLPQIQSLAAFPMPFALLGLHRYLRDPRPRWLALFAVGWFLQGICNGYYLLFFSVFVGFWMFWFASPWSQPRAFLTIGAAWLLAAIPMLPLLVHYRRVHETFGFTRDFGTIRDFGADIAALLFVTPHVTLWSWLKVYERAEGELFPGLTVTLLVMAGLLFVRDRTNAVVSGWVMARRILVALAAATGAIALSAVALGPWRFDPFGMRLLSVSNPVKPLTFALGLALALGLTSPGLRRAYATRAVLAFYGLMAFVMWLFSLGPAPTLMGESIMYRGPYSLLMFLPGFNALRVPARFWMICTLCLAVVGAIVFDRLAARLGTKRLALAALVAVGAFAETWMAEMPLAAVPRTFAAVNCPGHSTGPMIELPLGDTYADLAGMYRQMSHKRPLVNGYSGYFPPHYGPLRVGLGLRDPDVLTELAASGVNDVIVDRNTDPGGRWDRYVSAHPQAHLVCTEGKQSLYHVNAAAVAGSASGGGNSAVPVTAIRATVNADAVRSITDGDRTSRWESGPQREKTQVEVDLGTTRTIEGIDLSLGPYVDDFPRGLIIEASTDSQNWQEVWRGGSAGLAFAGASDAPRDVPLRYRFAPTAANTIRMRLTRNDDTFYWSIAEMKIVGR